MFALRLRYRVLLFVACSMLLIAFVKNNAINSAEAEEMAEVSKDVYEEEVSNTIQLSIYDGDYSTYKSKLAKTIEVDENLTLKQKVEKVMKSMSEALYKDLPIEVAVEDRSGKKIAVVNLVEPLTSNNKKFKEAYETLEDKSNTWQSYFSSGEAKSIVTLASMEATLKQLDYDGTWIDGYMIYHNGETLDDHRGLTTTDITWIRK